MPEDRKPPASPRPPSRFWQRMIPFFAHPTGLAIDRVLMRMFNTSLMGRMFLRAGGFPIRPHLLLRTIHWKTGVLRTVVLPFQRLEDDEGRERFVVIGSLAGRPRDPVWVLNVRAHPEVWFRVDRRWYFGHARIAAGEEREAVWSEVTADGAYIGYQKMARPRQLPLVVLEPLRNPTRPREDLLPERESAPAPEAR